MRLNYITKDLFPKPKPIKHGKEFTSGKKQYKCSLCSDEYWVTDRICQERKDLQYCEVCWENFTTRRRYYKNKRKI